MLLILAAQVFTNQNIQGLKTGNKEAAVTFTINNRLQEIVNTSFELEKYISKQNTDTTRFSAIKDSLAVMGYNASVLQKLNLDAAMKAQFTQLNNIIAKQLAISYNAIDALESGDLTRNKRLSDSLSALKISDRVYQTASAIDKGLEIKLQKTLGNTTDASQKLSSLNKAIALIAIAAILILGTIIINRHLRQVSLIKALELANEEVKKAALIKEQFMANMSHEIRTPLNAIKGFSRLMLQTPLNEDQKKFSGIIENSSNNLLHLVNDILDLAKIESGKMKIEQKEFDLKRMMQTLEFMFMNTASEKQLQYEWKLDKDVPLYLKGDADRLYQILINLISNAIKFTPAGYVNLMITKESETGNSIDLLFRIEDSGIGIPEEKQELIFERFQQVGQTDETMQKGTGLGLAIVKNLTLLLGGSVRVESSGNKGSVFLVLLPFEKLNAEKEFVPVVLNEADPKPEFSNARVLVAEDNKVNQLLISHLLKPYGIKPAIRENGLEIINLLKEQEFDLLLLDIQMPLLDGYKTSAVIRETNKILPIIAMTAYVMIGEKEKCLEAGMNDYLAKPIDEEELKEILITHLDNRIKKEKKKTNGLAHEEFLLQLAGGDEQMAEVILNEVKNEIPAEIEKLQQVIKTKDLQELSVICHHLISSISPLGKNNRGLKKINEIQKELAANADTRSIIELVEQLQDELEQIRSELSLIKSN